MFFLYTSYFKVGGFVIQLGVESNLEELNINYNNL